MKWQILTLVVAVLAQFQPEDEHHIGEVTRVEDGNNDGRHQGGDGRWPGNQGGDGRWPGNQGGDGRWPGNQGGDGRWPGNQGGDGDDHRWPGNQGGDGDDHRWPGNQGGDRRLPGNQGQPCYPQACTSMQCCTRQYRGCRATYDCRGQVVYVPWNWPNSGRR